MACLDRITEEMLKKEMERIVISGNIWECTVNLSLGGHLLLPLSDCPDSSNQGCAQPLKLQPPTDQILVIKSTAQLTVVELTVFAFMAPFEVNATLIIGRGPVCRIAIRVILFSLALSSPAISHSSFKTRNVLFGKNT